MWMISMTIMHNRFSMDIISLNWMMWVIYIYIYIYVNRLAFTNRGNIALQCVNSRDMNKMWMRWVSVNEIWTCEWEFHSQEFVNCVWWSIVIKGGILPFIFVNKISRDTFNLYNEKDAMLTRFFHTKSIVNIVL